MTDLELKIPEEVLETLPSNNKAELINSLARYFEEVINKYDVRFQKRVGGAVGGPLSRYERSILKDFLIDHTLSFLKEDETEKSFAAETLTTG